MPTSVIRCWNKKKPNVHESCQKSSQKQSLRNKRGFLNAVIWCDNQVLEELKYVHELQNLYFALTGEELSL